MPPKKRKRQQKKNERNSPPKRKKKHIQETKNKQKSPSKRNIKKVQEYVTPKKRKVKSVYNVTYRKMDKERRLKGDKILIAKFKKNNEKRKIEQNSKRNVTSEYFKCSSSIKHKDAMEYSSREKRTFNECLREI